MDMDVHKIIMWNLLVKLEYYLESSGTKYINGPILSKFCVGGKMKKKHRTYMILFPHFFCLFATLASFTI